MAYFTQVKAKNKQGYKWVCVKDDPPDPFSGERNQIARRGDSKKEAEARVDEALRKLTDHGIDEKKVKKFPFETVAWEWLNTYARSKVKASTVRVREKEIKILLRYIAKVNIDKVTSRMYQKILNDWDNKEYAKTTIEGVHVTAGMIFKYAIKEKMRKDNPCVGSVIPVKKLTVEEIENNTIEENIWRKRNCLNFSMQQNNLGFMRMLRYFIYLPFLACAAVSCAPLNGRISTLKLAKYVLPRHCIIRTTICGNTN